MVLEAAIECSTSVPDINSREEKRTACGDSAAILGDLPTRRRTGARGGEGGAWLVPDHERDEDGMPAGTAEKIKKPCKVNVEGNVGSISLSIIREQLYLHAKELAVLELEEWTDYRLESRGVRPSLLGGAFWA